ncbi:hypothetical protein WNY78_00560 [Psychroserpens sp. AS72]
MKTLPNEINCLLKLSIYLVYNYDYGFGVGTFPKLKKRKLMLFTSC